MRPPITTRTPASRRFRAWARPWLPYPMMATVSGSRGSMGAKAGSRMIRMGISGDPSPRGPASNADCAARNGGIGRSFFGAYYPSGADGKLTGVLWQTTGDGRMTSTRELFERHRLRCTQQRVALYEALASCKSHPTAEELFQYVKPAS